VSLNADGTARRRKPADCVSLHSALQPAGLGLRPEYSFVFVYFYIQLTYLCFCRP